LNGQIEDVAAFISAELSRITHWTVKADQLQHISQLLSKFRTVSAPRLASMRVLFGMNGTYPFVGDSNILLFEDGSSELRSLVFVGVSPAFCSPSLHNVTQLHIMGVCLETRLEYEEYREMLKELPQLVHLAIQGPLIFDMEQAFEDEPTDLGELRDLKLVGDVSSGLEMIQILRSIAAPKLASLLLVHSPEGAFNLITQCLSQEPQEWHGLPSLRRLALAECESSAEELIGWFRAFRSVQDLTILGPTHAIMFDALGSLHPHSEPLLPHLQSLTVPSVTSYDDLRTLADVRRIGGWALEKLILRGTDLCPAEDLDALRETLSVQHIERMKLPLYNYDDLIEGITE
jgi:hypothetical protein